MAVVALSALVVGWRGDSGPSSNADRITAVSKTVRCPVCAGESVAESNAEISKDIRKEIATRVEQGESDDEIRSALSANFGGDILLNPPSSGVGGLVWILPVVLLVVSFAGLAVAFRRWSEPLADEVTEADRALVAQALANDTGGVGGTDHGEGSGR
jgi:cytochrome c-type biogenesis protein CcmH